MSFGAISRYQAANLEQMEWAVSDPCPECAINSGAVVNIGSTFPSGANQPPAHPHCRCALLPVIPEFEPNANGVVDIAPKPVEDLIGGVAERDLISFIDTWDDIKTKKRAVGLDAAFEVKGYNGKPRVLSGAEFDAAADVAEARVYRGIAAKGTKAEQYAEAYKTGDHYAGLGIHGNGTYTSTNFNTARQYGRVFQEGEAGLIMDIAIPDASNFITVKDFKEKHVEFLDALFAKKRSLGDQRFAANQAGNTALADDLSEQISKIERSTVVLSEPSTAATLMGYDGLIVDSEVTNDGVRELFYIILNRAKVIVKKESTKP